MELLKKLQTVSEFAQKSGIRMPYDKALSIAELVKKTLVEVGVKPDSIEYGGSLRRKATTVGDVDVAIFDETVGEDTWRAVIDKLEKEGHEIGREYVDIKGKQRQLPLGPEQASFLLDGENVDLKKHSPENRGAMMIHMTGDVNFNVGMRAWLKQFGWGFSQAGLKNDKGEIVAVKDEKDIFAKLGIPYIEPKDRIGFTPPKNPPPGAKKQPYQGSVYKAPEADMTSGIPAAIYAKVPEDVKAKLKTFKLPDKDDQGNAVPRDMTFNPEVRHLYYKRRGTYRLPDEFKLDRYSKL